MDKNRLLISGAIVFKEHRGRRYWFIAKHKSEEDDWEIPKITVRKGESSARAAIRMMGEQGGMTARILEEAGRAGGVATVNGKVVPKRHLFYLMVQRSQAGEPIAFADYKWLEYAKAVRKLPSKRERAMIKQARQELRRWKKRQEREK